MTDREKAIVMAHTGICMLAGEKFGVFHAYIEDIMGRPVYTHELAIQSISDEIKEKSRDDFIKLCKEEQEPCEDTISRQATAKRLCELAAFINERRRGAGSPYVMAALFIQDNKDEFPPVTPKPKTWHWISHYDEDAKEGWYECDRCHTERAFNTKFCPDCGAKMIEPQERSNKENVSLQT